MLQNNGQLTQRTNHFGIARLALVVAALFLSASICSASATNVYIAQNAAGSANGADCADALAVGFFNSVANWGSAANQIGPGTTVHLCGVFTGTAGTGMFTVQASGTSGNPITILFENGADLTSPAWGAGGAIYIGSNAYITVNGGTNGVIENTANGTGMANQIPSTGIYSTGSNITIQNLTIQNIYVHTLPSDTTIEVTAVTCIAFSGSNVSIHDNVMHDTGWCLYQNYSNGDGNVNLYNNTIYNIDHGWAVFTAGHGGSSGPFSFYSNYVHDYSNWDTTAGVYHHDGVHCFSGGAPNPHITALNIYNNLFDGGQNHTTTYTAHVFLEGPNDGAGCMDSTGSVNEYNNVLLAAQPINNGLLGATGNAVVVNNTIIDTYAPDASNPNGLCVGVSNSTTSEVLENNVMSGCGILVLQQAGPTLTIDHNIYANSGTNAFICGANRFSTAQYANWQSCVGGDTNSSYNASAGLSTSGVPATGSPIAGKGVNFASFNISTLDWDTSAGNHRTPVARPMTLSTSWDVGAYQHGATVNLNPATGLNATSH